MCPPPWFNKELNEDVAKLIWDREIEFDPEGLLKTKTPEDGLNNPQCFFLVVSIRKEKALDEASVTGIATVPRSPYHGY
jgi:hypothetical protein